MELVQRGDESDAILYAKILLRNSKNSEALQFLKKLETAGK